MQDLVGQRIKAIRRQRGLSQAQLAHPELSDSYVSLIESGKRTPTPAVLELLAQKLDCSLTYLVNGVTAEQMDELEMGLRFARMALENGEVVEARRRYAELLADNSLLGLSALHQDARYGYALAAEACGDLGEAIAVLNELTGSEGETQPLERRIAVALALCRCYREEGDFAAAVEVGEQALSRTARGEWSDALIELGATLLVAYITRGDMLRSSHFAGELVAAAEALGTPRATVASCWNAAIVAERSGRGEEAMALMERALAIQSENSEGRNLTRLRHSYAMTILRIRPHEAATAREMLLRARRDYGDSATSMADRARCHISLAHAELELGHPERAVEYVGQAQDFLTDGTREFGIDGYLLRAQAHYLLHRDEEAREELAIVSQYLEDAKPTRATAETWMGVGELQDRLGDHGSSAAAYHRALASAGI